MDAQTFGQIDDWIAKPTQPGDERFHQAISGFLYEWARLHRPRFQAVRVVGDQWSARSHELRDLLGRNSIPFGFYPVDSDQGQGLLGSVDATGETLPVVVLFDGRVLVDPSNAALAEALGVRTSPAAITYDVAVIGAGPAGLAAAVYGASEGLRTIVLEPEAIGGQAGTSSMIRNYLGFPRGVSGAELAQRAYEQAWMLRADFVYGQRAVGLRAAGPNRVVRLSEGSEVASRAVILATGVSYRRLGVPGLEALVGAGVFYGAAASEAQAMKGQQVYVVGGANSAGQAAVHLARYASHVTMLVRGSSLAATMSDYLVREIQAAPNVAVRLGMEVVDGHGEGRLAGLTLRDQRSGATQTVSATALFVLIGAEPRTGWLPEAIQRDRWGFIVTGTDLLQARLRRWLDPDTVSGGRPGGVMFSIGDFARHGRVSVRMLRHYDAIGLLRPASVDPVTGYRSYEAGQLARLNRIVALKDLGFTLEQVGSILDEKVGVEELRGMLRLRQAELQAQLERDTSRLAQIEARLRIIEREGAMPTDEVQIKRIPAVRVAQLTATAASFEPQSIGPVIQPLYDELISRLDRAGLTPTGPGIAWYEDAPDGEGVLVHATLPVDADPGDAHDFTVVDLPGIERAATILHHGSMDDVMPAVQALARWIDANGHRSAGYNRELYLECDGSRDTWVTELQEPLATT